MLAKTTKRLAAHHLLSEALAALLDRGDALTAIVLGDAAEDVYAGLLKRESRAGDSAMQEMVPHVRAFAAIDDPSAQPPSDKRVITAMRRTFDWLRHNDWEIDPQEREVDFDLEAAAIIERAIVNEDRLTGVAHPRWQELLARHGRDAER